MGRSAFKGNALTTVVFEGDRPTFAADVFTDNPALITVNYYPATAMWPGANIAGIPPTLFTAAPVAAPVAMAESIPTLSPVLLLLLCLCLCLVGFIWPRWLDK